MYRLKDILLVLTWSVQGAQADDGHLRNTRPTELTSRC